LFRGLEYFMSTISILRLMGHIKYAFVKFDILKITKHPEDGTVKVRWRIKGISGMKIIMKLWKFNFWNLEQVIKENVESYVILYCIKLYNRNKYINIKFI